MSSSDKPTKERRAFLNSLLGISVGTSLAAILYPIARFMNPPHVAEATQRSVVAAKVGELTPDSGKIFQFGTKPGLLIDTPNGELKAFSAVCTHLDCTVEYREGKSDIHCACHNGVYDLNGRNVSGPPPRPLEEYQVNVRGDEIIVSKG